MNDRYPGTSSPASSSNKILSGIKDLLSVKHSESRMVYQVSRHAWNLMLKLCLIVSLSMSRKCRQWPCKQCLSYDVIDLCHALCCCCFHYSSIVDLLDFFCSCTVESMSLFYLLLYIDLYVLGNDASISWGSFVRTKHLCGLISELVPFNMFKPSCDFLLTATRRYFFCGTFLLFMYHVCLIILWCMFLAALWSPAGKGLAAWISFLFVMLPCVFFHFPIRCLGRVRYLIVSIPNICLLLYLFFFWMHLFSKELHQIYLNYLSYSGDVGFFHW